MDLEKPYQDMLERAEYFQAYIDREAISLWYDLQSESVASELVDYIDEPSDMLAKIIAIMANTREEICSNRAEAVFFKCMAYAQISLLIDGIVHQRATSIAERKMESSDYEQHEGE